MDIVIQISFYGISFWDMALFQPLEFIFTHGTSTFTRVLRTKYNPLRPSDAYMRQ